MQEQSSWLQRRRQSNYHFDSTRRDTEQEVMTHLGRVPVTWQRDLDTVIKRSRPATWATRGYKSQAAAQPAESLAAEEYDLVRVGADPDMIITNLNWDLPPSLQQLQHEFALDDCMARIHVQWPGQVWTRHIDKLEKWAPDRPHTVMRIMIQLTPWQPGHFWEWGTHHWTHWQVGDVITFDWPNMPHATANAGHDVRVTLQLTGRKTPDTGKFIESLKETQK